MTAQGRITTAKLTPGTEILAFRETDGTLSVANKRTGSIIVKVTGEVTSYRKRQRNITTDHGSLYASGQRAHFLATDNDRKRVAREAHRAADRAQATADSASVLDGVAPVIQLSPITVTESGVRKLARHTGKTPAQVRKAVNRQPDMRTEDAEVGTVTVRGEARKARRDTDGVLRFWRADCRWVKCTPAQASTFVAEEDDPSGIPHARVTTRNERSYGVHSYAAVEPSENPELDDIVAADVERDRALDLLATETEISDLRKVAARTRDSVARRIARERLSVDTAVSVTSTTTEGTVKRGNRTLPARHTKTGDSVTVEFSPRAGEWLPAGKTVARTFQRTLDGKAPVVTSAAESVAVESRESRADFTVGSERWSVSPDPASNALMSYADKNAATHAYRNFVELAEECPLGSAGRKFWAKQAKRIYRATGGRLTRGATA